MTNELLSPLACFGLLALSLLNIGLRERRWSWMLSIPVTEGGHWLALVTLAFLGCVVFTHTGWWVVEVVILLVALSLFLRPVRSAYCHQRKWSRDLSNAFGGEIETLVTLKTLFLGWRSSVVPHEIISVPDIPDFHFFRAQGLSEASPGVQEQTSVERAPFVVVVHGGGWDSGDPTQLPELNSWLARQGVAVFSVSYRLLPTGVWPAQREDVDACITYIKQNSLRFGVDADRWVLLGRSAGAQIAGCVAYGARAREQGCRGLILFYPCTDLVFGYEVAEEHDLIESRELLRKLLGGRPLESPDVYADASFIEHIRPDTVATLSMHGWPDRLCFYKHSERLHTRLDHKGVRNASLILPWAQHGFDWSLRGPGGQISTRAVAHFLSQQFGQKI